MFSASPHGIRIKFKNGYAVSVQFGPGNYCHNRNKTEPVEDCITAETAIIDRYDRFVSYKGDHVQGYQSPADVLETLNYVAGLHTPPVNDNEQWVNILQEVQNGKRSCRNAADLIMDAINKEITAS
jgi:hypothetical protein